MRKRNIEIKVRLSRKEADDLAKRVRKSRLSREAYLRHLINGVVPREAPPPEYFDFMRDLQCVGCSKRLCGMWWRLSCFLRNGGDDGLVVTSIWRI